MLNNILDVIKAGINGSLYSDHHSAADDRAAWKVIIKYAPNKSEHAAKEIIKTWVTSGVLVRHDYYDPVRRKTVKGLNVDDAKRPS